MRSPIISLEPAEPADRYDLPELCTPAAPLHTCPPPTLFTPARLGPSPHRLFTPPLHRCDDFFIKSRPSLEALESQSGESQFPTWTFIADQTVRSGIVFCRFRLAAAHEITFFVKNELQEALSVGQRQSRLWPLLPPYDEV